MKNENLNRRTPLEDKARGRCRALVRSLDSKLAKVEKKHVAIAPCKIWPRGLITAFHGWIDLYDRLELCRNRPEFVVDGFYIYDPAYDYESIDLEHVRELAEDLPAFRDESLMAGVLRTCGVKPSQLG